MSDVSNAFAPVRAKIYRAELGTSVAGITGTSVLPPAFKDMGALSLSSGVSFSPAGEPTRTVVREFYDDRAFHTSKSPSDQLPTLDVTALESNREVIEAALGATIDEDGKLVYFGGIPQNACYVVDLADGSANPKTQRWLVPNGSASINGSISSAGSEKLQQWPLRLTGEPSEDIGGGLFAMWSNWLADGS